MVYDWAVEVKSVDTSRPGMPGTNTPGSGRHAKGEEEEEEDGDDDDL
jgi:hypothetical protein